MSLRHYLKPLLIAFCMVRTMDTLVIKDIEMPEPRFCGSYNPKEGKTSNSKMIGEVAMWTDEDYNWDVDEDWKSIAKEQTIRANNNGKERAEYKFKYEALIKQLRKAKVIGKPCPRCGSFQMTRSSDRNYISGVGAVVNTSEECPKCGHFEMYGPRW